MKPHVEISTFDVVVESLETIWNPGTEALKLQHDLDVRCVRV